MLNIAIALRQEITRLARREARSLTRPLHRVSSQFRRDIAELKRQNAKARAEIVRLQRESPPEAGAPGAEGAIETIRYSPARLKAQRKRLGFSAEAFGKLVGVTGHTVYKWEHGSSRPRRKKLAAIAALRGIGKTEAKVRLGELQAKPGAKRNSVAAK